MITKAQAIALGANHCGSTCIHYTGRHNCTRIIGKRGGVTERITAVRPSGRCQTWKTRPEEFRLPVKYGLYEHAEITHRNADEWHVASDCPIRQTLADTPDETIGADIPSAE